jgi:tetratricopeptide (TPR) repeat protein
MGKAGITLTLVLAWACALGQEQRDFRYYDGLTYSQYLAGNWDDVIQTARNGLDAGYDYYYLRMRLAIAYYNKSRFRQADRHFRQALRYDSLSAAAKEYLYYANMYLGREQTAQSYYDVRENPANPFFHSIYLEGGLKSNTSNTTTTGDIRYGLVSLRHQLSARLHYYHAYQNLVRTATERGQGSGGPTEARYNIIQHAYYGRVEVLAGRTFWLVPAFHWMGWSAPEASGSDWLASFGLVKDIGLIRLYADGSWSNINEEKQVQVNAGLVVYPLGNPYFYIDNLLIVQQESGDRQLGARHILGGRPGKTTWLQAWYAHGAMRHFSELNGLVVFNTPNTIDSRWGVSLVQAIGVHSLGLHYINEQKNEPDTGRDFTHNNFILGLYFKLF